ncbi:MAG: large subunit ribosomal protein [Solirubrobacteraceae bacterium]|jgi:ribosomal protein L22|nr:large subunit ribosomal protein [Solirubrobacteraceae bacterium]
MADETQAGAEDEPKAPDEPTVTDQPTAKAEPDATAEPTTDEPTAEPATDEPAATAAPAAKPAAAKAKKPASAAKDKAEASAKPAKPAAGRTQSAEQAKPGAPAKPVGAAKPIGAAKPARPGLRGRVKGRGRGAKADGPPVELPVVRAQAKYVRTSARKARLVCDHIRGKSVTEAQAILAFAPRAVAADWAKLLKSAVANAENNHELLGENLRVKEAFADEGPTLKRFRPRAMGRATPIRKRTSHLTITLTPKE